ncbi:MAG: serine hydrolase, partial [Planctomycetota bacterium]|nr:serine hydrolase [Planctomycetota bacterium]
PVDIPELAAYGDGLTVLPAGTDLEDAAPTDEDCAADLPARIRARLETAVAERAFPGAVAVVARRGRVVAEVAVGRMTYGEDAAPITAESRFDLASLTKVCATTPAVMRLVDQGRLQLDARIKDLLQGFDGADRETIEVRHLLTHTAGLPPFLRFFETLDGRDAIVDACLSVPLQSEPGSTYRYSDIGLILLMAIVEEVTGEAFDAFVAREVFAPLGMTSARFVRRGETLAGAVPTEQDGWRGRLVRGEVHDENAYAMGGVSGHAGLFADARDVTRLAHAFLGGGRGLARPDLVRRFVTRQEIVPGSSRALGWDTFEAGGSCGSKLAPTSFGHTGFTGTSVWCDPTRDLSIVLLTNRVHPTRDNKGHIAVRRELADLVVQLIDG